ncbi:MAG: thermonuclease family protein [Rhodopseudomonas sp.]|uniref:thermonuclease family protein n=1 Tax=Rhodopseudomonas sp. TaxID=1078 RepID=UPI00181669C4|nr:thermonuclease family protein [Rhodopseudomonas sp.]NVN85422.1 thermonuclease family protein [Rhodopseudomonas sp.]
MLKNLVFALAVLLLPAMANAADVSGIPKIHDGDQVLIGRTRIRMAGIDAPGLDQLCLDPKGERWTCGVAARDELARHVGNKSWNCHLLRIDRFGRSVAKCEVDGEDVQQWMVKSGWALAYVQFSHAYDEDQKAARAAKLGMWQGAFIAPWDWRVRNKKTAILGTAKVPASAIAILLASASGPVAPSPECTIKGNVNRSGVCIYHKPTSRWYAKIKMTISKGTRWFCSVQEAEEAGCRETRR